MSESASRPIDTSVPHSARIWNYLLGGKDYYEVDRVAGEAYREAFPGIVDIARGQRYFLDRAVQFLAGEAGIRQFLDIGTGLPTQDNTHELAQRVAPEAHIVYVDNDPLVLAHAGALLTSSPEGRTYYVEADVRDPDVILAAAAERLDFSRPVALTMLGVLGHIGDEEQPHAIVRRLVEGLPVGSYVALADGTDTNREFAEAQRRYNEGGSVPYTLRSPDRMVAFFDGLELVEPGVVPLPQWRPQFAEVGAATDITHELCGVGRKLA
ncbi:SAM-dependent methyltransferase [Streptomyces sp. MP131-18]|uniref:SAM-dependent methyltransferase n=1 Tax=Streptomyces sp. MP131-18 TaxID=1857892 RepID=UPI00097C6C33|nr:SAM-dependent methyltransferase [Streptomyces sp. MP131-18]ONK09308.1 S-adenosyl methyltransferase [Streptomyces sp. MP131-18]